MTETARRRSVDGSAIAQPLEAREDLWQDGKRVAAHPTTAPVPEDGGCALHAARASLSEAGGRSSSLPITPPPEVRTDWPRGIGELGTEGMDPSRPLSEEPTLTGRLSPD